MPAEALNCPNCGASVSSESSLCEFCKTRLKTVACTHCLRMMFAGSQFCQHCGAIAAPLNVSLDDDSVKCPRCGRSLRQVDVEGTTMRTCEDCDGVWMSNEVFETVCADAERRSAVLGYFRQRPDHHLGPTKVNYVPCPYCRELMNRANFARASGVIIDVCKRHGAWFDADELPAIIEFVQKGGMEIARQRQLREIEDERQRLRTERLDPSGSAIIGSSQDADNLGIRSFVKALFG